MESDTRSTFSVADNLALEHITVGACSCAWVDWVELSSIVAPP